MAMVCTGFLKREVHKKTLHVALGIKRHKGTFHLKENIHIKAKVSVPLKRKVFKSVPYGKAERDGAASSVMFDTMSKLWCG